MECGPTWEHILYFVFGRCWLTVDLYTTERLTVETSQSIWKFRLTVLKQWSWKTSRLAVNCHTYHKRNIFFLRKSNMREQTLARRLSFLYTRNSLHEARSIWILKQYLAALHSTTRVWSKPGPYPGTCGPCNRTWPPNSKGPKILGMHQI